MDCNQNNKVMSPMPILNACCTGETYSKECAAFRPDQMKSLEKSRDGTNLAVQAICPLRDSKRSAVSTLRQGSFAEWGRGLWSDIFSDSNCIQRPSPDESRNFPEYSSQPFQSSPTLIMNHLN